MSTSIVPIDHSSQLANLDRARQMLAECRTLPEVKKIRDIAEAAKVYAKAAHLGREAQNYAAEIAVRASRKAGEILKQLNKSKGGNAKHAAASVAGASEYAKTLEETDTPERTAQYWQKIAEVREQDFEKTIRETVGSGQELTAARILRLAKSEKPKPQLDVLSEIKKLLTPLMPDGADGQLKLAELLESAPETVSPENSEHAVEVCSLLRMIAKHFTDSARALEAAANRNPVARVA